MNDLSPFSIKIQNLFRFKNVLKHDVDENFDLFFEIYVYIQL